MLSPELEHILQLLYREARNARYEFISLEHLLLVLIEEDAAVPNVLKLCGADLKVLSEQLAASVAENTPQIPDHLLDTVETQPTLGFQRVIQRAMVHTQSAPKAMPFISSNCNPLRALKSCVALPMARPMTKTAMIQTA